MTRNPGPGRFRSGLEIGACGGENPMDLKVDAYVCEPEVGISPKLGAVFIQFQVIDGGTQESNGKSHTVLWPCRTQCSSRKRCSMSKGGSPFPKRRPRPQ